MPTEAHGAGHIQPTLLARALVPSLHWWMVLHSRLFTAITQGSCAIGVSPAALQLKYIC